MNREAYNLFLKKKNVNEKEMCKCGHEYFWHIWIERYWKRIFTWRLEYAGRCTLVEDPTIRCPCKEFELKDE